MLTKSYLVFYFSAFFACVILADRVFSDWIYHRSFMMDLAGLIWLTIVMTLIKCGIEIELEIYKELKRLEEFIDEAEEDFELLND